MNAQTEREAAQKLRDDALARDRANAAETQKHPRDMTDAEFNAALKSRPWRKPRNTENRK